MSVKSVRELAVIPRKAYMHSKKVLLLGGSSVVVVISAAVFIYLTFLRVPELTLTVSPANASVEIDGKPLQADTLKSSVGTHQLKVSALGFVTYEKSVEFVRAKTTHIAVLLKPIPTAILLSSNVTDSENFAKDPSIFFLGNGGKTLYQTKTDPGQAAMRAEAITPDTLSDIKQVIWRPDAGVAFLKRSDGIYLYDFMRYDLLNQTMTLWGTGIDQIAWDPRGLRVAYTWYGPNNEQSLIFSDIQNKNISRVANLVKENIEHPLIIWAPNGEQLLMIGRSEQKKTNYLYSFDIFSKKVTQISDIGEVEGAEWSPDGNRIAYTAPGRDQDGKNSLIVWVANADGSGLSPLGVGVASISKVTWAGDSQSLVVAVSGANDDQLVNVDLGGTITPYQYNTMATFHPNHLVQVGEDNRIMFNMAGSLYSLSLISPRYQ